jgi:predicted nucleic acid-binding protein
MKVIVDTCVWSLALRKDSSKDEKTIKALTELIREVRVQLIGPIRQEILSGIKSEKRFTGLKEYFSAFLDLDLEPTDYEKAAEFFNICRRKGIQGSNTDFLICAAAFNRELEIFTIDKDFKYFKKYIPIKLFEIKNV